MPRARTSAASRTLTTGGILLVLAVVGLMALWWLGPLSTASSAEPFLKFQNQSGFPNEEVWVAYRFALDNPGGILNYIPCFCGCRSHGDKNNRDCYLDGFDRDGRPKFDPHAAG